MFDLGGILDDVFQDLRDGTATFLGLMCFLVFVVNACLLVWLGIRKGRSTLARCPRCGRSIVCMHCSEDEPPPAS